jgi:hypothetical protein
MIMHLLLDRTAYDSLKVSFVSNGNNLDDGPDGPEVHLKEPTSVKSIGGDGILLLHPQRRSAHGHTLLYT